MSGDPARRDQIAQGLVTVEQRIAAACSESGREREEVTLVVVTKFFPASDVRHLAELGVRDVAENRHQEAVAKREECGDLELTWHFVGGLQSNKAAALAQWADVVHSVDRPRLVPGLDRGAEQRGRELAVLVQVSLDPPTAHEGRSGADPAQLADLVQRVQDADRLRLRGVMGVAPLGGDPASAFAELASLAARVREQAPGAEWISAGMSGDLEHAVRQGATHVRVGSAVLGNRPRRR